MTILCATWNLLVCLSIVWFIVSVEMTIRSNNIQGVHTIDSTGQLIPFVIGCLSTWHVLKRLALLGLAKVSTYFSWVILCCLLNHKNYCTNNTPRQRYPNWQDVDIVLGEDGNGWRIIDRSHEGTAERRMIRPSRMPLDVWRNLWMGALERTFHFLYNVNTR